ncbi:unnamed protein product [Choristocarpus tenellus]
MTVDHHIPPSERKVGYRQGKTVTVPSSCTVCLEEFPSRGALFRHLRDTTKTCSAFAAENDNEGEKCLISFGYKCNTELGVSSGNDAGSLLFKAVTRVSTQDTPWTGNHTRVGFSQASSNHARRCPWLNQEAGVHAMADTACLRAPSAVPPSQVLEWISGINTHLEPFGVKIFGRMKVPASLHAELHATKRRVEYLLPAWLVDQEANTPWTDQPRGKTSLLPLLQRLRMNALKPFGSCGTAKKGENGFKRRRRPLWHNFSAGAVPHSPSVARRMYRFHCQEMLTVRGVDYICLSISGDAFLEQQVRAMVGLAVAAVRGLIGGKDGIADKIAACFDPSNVDSLLPIPLAPLGVSFLAENGYAWWQGKLGGVLLSPGAPKVGGGGNASAPAVLGWSDEAAYTAASAWRSDLLDSAAGWWEARELGAVWLRDVLEPGAAKLKEALRVMLWRMPGRDVRHETVMEGIVSVGKSDQSANENLQAIICSLETPKPVVSEWQAEVEPCNRVSPQPPIRMDDAPEVYRTVLCLLREADASGKWPASTSGRQMVMAPTANGKPRRSVELRETGEEVIYQNNPRRGGKAGIGKGRRRVGSAVEGVGKSSERKDDQVGDDNDTGRPGGSFTVGYFPYPAPPPQGNALFPDLVRAAFALEAALMPDRPPSSTIAINRHAQFRPHTDSGDGSGQSRSLIVGLGDYGGGELVVEGGEVDIRYQPLEFNGWTQRHWTLPFWGERYSLVWFTPRGCEDFAGAFLDSREVQ